MFFSSFFLFLVCSILKVVEKNADDASDSASNTCDNAINNISSCNQLMPYRLTEQFVISLQKDKEPAVRFFSVSFVDFIVKQFW